MRSGRSEERSKSSALAGLYHRIVKACPYFAWRENERIGRQFKKIYARSVCKPV